MQRLAFSSSSRCVRSSTNVFCARAVQSRQIQYRAGGSRLPPLVFTFDIDGVLLRGPHTIPAARRALDMLNGANPMGVKIPFILLTNGGGTHEEVRKHKLSSQLGVQIHSNQIVQAHTILKSVAHKYADKPVLVLGGLNDVVRKVAESYGFKQAYTTLDVLAWKPEAWPFHELTPEERASTKPVDFSTTPISAIFVFHDPRNWSLDMQITLDVIRSGGIIGGPYLDTPKPADQQPLPQHERAHSQGAPSQHRQVAPKGEKPPIEVVFCNPDLLWKSDFPQPRLGQGAFRMAFQTVYEALVGTPYPHVTQYGKPTAATYKFAEKVLRDRLEELAGGRVEEMPRVYMVGDNPESDIAGANAAGWPSVLVKTGVYEEARGPPTHTPTYIAEDVEEAVRWAIDREMKQK
ncbi:HAD hydrolase [Lentinus tigrinus ALCF2SS1-7]|uniref:HAD hydrolase n=1 Tax=Lentinus tigrinus ALCF2SS1-6 TaxID=1328759 RepID=A0A5C2RT93_9APHY|nr:HAD hydrolase [Lentinus tigrinus ALCF2SS1-6]RPD73817.1 HAD hydrolase [Lentinus tigrinus ALCF2SS1-7]